MKRQKSVPQGDESVGYMETLYQERREASGDPSSGTTQKCAHTRGRSSRNTSHAKDSLEMVQGEHEILPYRKNKVIRNVVINKVV